MDNSSNNTYGKYNNEIEYDAYIECGRYADYAEKWFSIDGDLDDFIFYE